GRDDPRLLKAASLAQLRLGDRQAAIRHAEALVALAGVLEDRFYLATLLEGAGETAAAIETYRGVLGEAADYWPALNNLAYLLAEGDGSAEALGLARRAVLLAPDQPVVMHTLGWSQFRAGEVAAAVLTLTRAVDLAPDSALYHY